MNNTAFRVYFGIVTVEIAVLVALLVLTPDPWLIELPPGWSEPGLELAPPPPFIEMVNSNPFLLTLVLLTVAGVTAALLHAVFMLRKPKYETREDERTEEVARMSAYYAFIVVVPQLFAMSIFLMALDKPRWTRGWESDAGVTLMLIAMLLLMAYSISHYVIDRRMRRDG
ncbi:MAG: DUF2178 domain-containing protein [Methanomassiliicoccaceae archaeon]|nr:DUF2178 domain-containing protein [Methanomassiliicoccaceae archaeon]